MDPENTERTSPSGISYSQPTAPRNPVQPAPTEAKPKWEFQWSWKWWLLLVFVVLPLLRWLSQYVN